jgi:hypothetical protein
MKLTRILSASLLLASVVLALAPAARASNFPNLTYSVTLNLSALALNPNAPFSLDLQLVTGSGAPNVTNTVVASNFVFTGGSANSTPVYSAGNESGTPTGSVTLTTGTTPAALATNEVAFQLSSGVTQVSFNVSQTPNSELVNSGLPTNDEFNVAILDSGLNNIVTTDPSGAAFDTYRVFTSTLSETQTAAQNQYFSVVVTPEPGSAALSFIAVGGFLALVMVRRRLVA